ncbi:hypothetical protein P43SY_000334 [Pythium insidiosum]|uniref:L-dopachrome isomerase n=1 Tax=Pythium insidiosum TaxID=114742 RepID=A0AAD5LDZ2_PYTIN|nr:hypothetical protein P43SY_000334 [Pythium insidiosum]
MPYVVVTSNVAATSIDVQATLRAISSATSKALGKPETYVMVQLDLDKTMMFEATTDPCAMIAVRSIGNIGIASNSKTCEALTAVVSEALGVPARRVFMNFDDVERANWGMGGITLPTHKILNMPFVKVSTNVARASVNADSTLKALSKSLSEALDRPEPYVMVQLELDQDMLMAGSTEVCVSCVNV